METKLNMLVKFLLLNFVLKKDRKLKNTVMYDFKWSDD